MYMPAEVGLARTEPVRIRGYGRDPDSNCYPIKYSQASNFALKIRNHEPDGNIK